MPEIRFDPPNVNWEKYLKPTKKMYGGSLKAEERSEYMELCKAITSRDPSLDYERLRDKILKIMKEDVIAYVHTLPKDNQAVLLDYIESFYKGIDKDDTPFNCINIFGLQIAILFSEYHEPDTEKYYLSSAEGYSTASDYAYFLNKVNWKSYNDLRKAIRGSEFKFITASPDPKDMSESKPIFMLFIGFLRLGELMETILNNVFLCSVSYTIEYVDGIKMNPIASLWHDGKFHYDMFISCLKLPNIIKEVRGFHKYISTKDRAIQYAINFVLFHILHEGETCFREEMEENSLNTHLFNEMTKESIYNEVASYIYGFRFLYFEGSAIPKSYRVIVNEEKGELDKEKIKEYLHVVSEIYVNTYREYQAQKQGGGGSTRKRARKSTRGFSARRAARP
jgi:hypothetical protein